MVRWVVGSILHRGGWGVLSYFLSGQRDVAPWQERSLMVRKVVGSIFHEGWWTH